VQRDGAVVRHNCMAIAPDGYSASHLGLAAALKRKPTVARYMLYFKYLQAACFDNESGPYGEARRYHGTVMCDNFPENEGSTEENMIRKSLKRRKLLSMSFPKRLVLGQVVPPMAAQSLP
jgi:hypothetical protein